MATVECIWKGGNEVGECPVWAEDEQCLYWVDIEVGRLYRLDPATGADKVWQLPAAIGCFARRTAGGIMAALQSGFFIYDLESGAMRMKAEPLKGAKARFNDGRADRAGRFFWAGTMGQPPDATNPAGAFYRLTGAGVCTRVIDGMIVSNGLAFSPDGLTMYASDSNPQVQSVWAWDYDPEEGAVSNRRLLVDMHDLDGRPDGAAVDADGCYWTAANDGWQLIRFTPEGKVDRTIRLPIRKPTMPCFGGPGLDTLFVTSIKPAGSTDELDGGVFAVPAGCKGLPEPKFVG